MPRPWELKVEPWPDILSERAYAVTVLAVQKSIAPPGLRVEVQHVEPEQAGRKHTQVLPLPIRPAGLTAEFFAACGIKAAAGETINPKAAVGRRLRVRFAQASEGEEPKPTTFESLPVEEPTDDQ